VEIVFRKCLPDHLAYIKVQDAQLNEQTVMLNTEYASVATSHVALSAWRGNECLGAAGFVPIFATRAIAWALLSRNIGYDMPTITKKIRKVIALDPTPRIEMTVDARFEAGHRWARLIGMSLETPEPLRCHGANGEDEMMYARVR